VIDKSNLGYGYGSFSTIFTGITAGNNDILLNGQFYTTTPEGIRIPSLVQPEKKKPSLKYSRNAISFTWTTTSYVGEEKTEYRYKLDGLDKDWSKWEKRNSRDFTSLPFGHYTFRLIAKTLTGLESNELNYSFSVRKPWYATFPVLLLFILIGLLAVYALIRFYTWRLKSENMRLENLIKQRNALVNRQKEEIDASVHYASRIQTALLPSEKLLADATLNNYFILYKPLDKVSGDFYWIARKSDRLFVAVADCTGHGVPGAFMSLLGISFLDEIVNKVTLTKPGIILDELRKQVVNSLKQTGETDEQKDEVDLAMIAVDFKRYMVEFAGAYNPCFKVRAMNNEEILKWESGDLETEESSLSNGKYLLETVAADKMPIGISAKMDKAFKQTEWKLDRDYSYYLFTDGYIDQFNGNTGKKFMKRNFKKLILDIQDYPMSKQKEILEERLLSWMGSSPQVDDILVVGLKAEWPTI
jgi:serine phosphatase RsbU (regulator of sigma subunit)